MGAIFFQPNHGEKKSIWWDNDNVHFEQHVQLDFFSSNSLKWLHCINMSSHKHIILISSQPSLCSYSSILRRVPSRETENINFVVFGLTRLGLEPNIYHIWGEHAMSLTTTSPMWLPIDRHTIACKWTWDYPTLHRQNYSKGTVCL